MNDKLSGAVEALLIKLEEQTRQVVETKKLINSLQRMMGEEPQFSDSELEELSPGTIRPDLYYGKPLATAAREYLESRKRACQPEEILKALQQGGFDFDRLGWSEKDWLRNFSMSLAKNTAIFHRLPNGPYGLKDWYPELTKRKIERVIAPANLWRDPTPPSQPAYKEDGSVNPEEKTDE